MMSLLAPLLLAVSPAAPHLPPPVRFDRVAVLTASPARGGRVDFVAVIEGPLPDAWNPRQAAVDLEVSLPSGRRLTLPAYPSRVRPQSSEWRAHLRVQETGDHRATFSLSVPSGHSQSSELRFSAGSGPAPGFLRTDGPWVLRRDDGTPFRGIGENIGWESRSNDDSRYFRALHEHARFGYPYLLGSLAAQGGNFFRTWMCAWNLPLEWNQVVDTDRYTASPERYNPSAIAAMDDLVERMEALDLRVMLTLDTAGSFLGGHWELNPYNVRNGGPAADALAFFTAPGARLRYQDRLRYLVARWGHSPAIAAWEFFNEVDNTLYGVQPRIPDEPVVAWHREMAAYLKGLDPYRRIVTTSISHREVSGLFGIPDIDLNQRHIYGRTDGFRTFLEEQVGRHGRPFVIGEYGFEWDWSKDFNTFEADMLGEYRRGLWLGLFSPTPILPMTWWWEYFDEKGAKDALRHVRSVSDRMLQAGGGSFETVAAPPDAPAWVAAVRCGTTLFVLARPGEAGAHLPLPAAPSDGRPVRATDTVTGSPLDLPVTAAPSGPGVALPAGNDLILELPLHP